MLVQHSCASAAHTPVCLNTQHIHLQHLHLHPAIISWKYELEMKSLLFVILNEQ